MEITRFYSGALIIKGHAPNHIYRYFQASPVVSNLSGIADNILVDPLVTFFSYGLKPKKDRRINLIERVHNTDSKVNHGFALDGWRVLPVDKLPVLDLTFNQIMKPLDATIEFQLYRAIINIDLS